MKKVYPCINEHLGLLYTPAFLFNLSTIVLSTPYTTRHCTAIDHAARIFCLHHDMSVDDWQCSGWSGSAGKVTVTRMQIVRMNITPVF